MTAYISGPQYATHSGSRTLRKGPGRAHIHTPKRSHSNAMLSYGKRQERMLPSVIGSNIPTTVCVYIVSLPPVTAARTSEPSHGGASGLVLMLRQDTTSKDWVVNVHILVQVGCIKTRSRVGRRDFVERRSGLCRGRSLLLLLNSHSFSIGMPWYGLAGVFLDVRLDGR